MATTWCSWPRGCMAVAYGGLCYYHVKVAGGLFETQDLLLDALNTSDVLSDTQLEIARLMANLDANPDQVRRALARERST